MQDDLLFAAKDRGNTRARQLFSNLNRVSGNTRARNLGTRLKNLLPSTVAILFEGIEWRGCPDDAYEKMEQVFSGLGEVVKAMGPTTDPFIVLSFFFEKHPQLDGRSPFEAWKKKRNHVWILLLASSHNEHISR